MFPAGPKHKNTIVWIMAIKSMLAMRSAIMFAALKRLPRFDSSSANENQYENRTSRWIHPPHTHSDWRSSAVHSWDFGTVVCGLEKWWPSPLNLAHRRKRTIFPKSASHFWCSRQMMPTACERKWKYGITASHGWIHTQHRSHLHMDMLISSTTATVRVHGMHTIDCPNAWTKVQWISTHFASALEFSFW